MQEQNYDINYENDSTSNYLVLSPKKERKLIEYQIQMLLNNRIYGLLDLHINTVGNQVNCFYDITSKCTLTGIMSRKKYNRCEFLVTMLMITKSIIGIKDYLLNDSNILLDENNIYVDPETMNLFFVYLPFQNNSNDIKTFLLNIIIKLAKFQEEDCDNYIQKILENIKSEMFNLSCLKELLENLLGQDIKRDTSNECTNTSDKPEPEKPKTPIKRGEVKIPNLPIKECSKTFSKISFTQVILQPVLLVMLITILLSKFVQMSENPKTTGIILSLIFIGIDILTIRILNEKKTDSPQSYKPLKYITEKMKENNIISDKEPNTDMDNKKPEEFHTEKANRRSGETVILKESQPKDTPYLQASESEEIIKVDKKSILVGRMGNFVDYIIDNNAVGKVHAEISHEDDSYFIMDCSSKNGTYLNENRLKPNTKIKINNKDVIRFANKEFIFTFPS